MRNRVRPAEVPLRFLLVLSCTLFLDRPKRRHFRPCSIVVSPLVIFSCMHLCFGFHPLTSLLLLAKKIYTTAEFAESKYIFVSMASMLQALISGMPVLFFVKDMPQAYYMVFVLFFFIVSMVIMLVIFVPKMM